VVVLLTRWVSKLFEGWVYEPRWIPEGIGIALTAGVGLALLAGALRLFFLKPGYEQRLVALEEQGWFSAAAYKRSQGQRVRRGTILGILIIVGYGIWSLHSHDVLSRGAARDWAVNVPFTGKVPVKDLGDAAVLYGYPESLPVVDQGTFRERNEQLKKEYVKVEKRGDSDAFEPGQLVTKTEFEAESKKLLAEDRQPPVYRAPEPAKGEPQYLALTLLPDVKYTLPLLLGALGLWGAWRLVNVPAFADFLIATEAELNKVSWTSRRRLFQDTVVVLVTVVLLTVFLFVVDFFWGAVLQWKPIGVLKLPEGTGQTEQKAEPW
jgi:preprotein translocase SecE subunit